MSELIKALVSAKKKFGVVTKNSINPHYKSRYADLSACIEATESALLENGIVVIQSLLESDTGVKIETAICHVSGEKISSSYSIPVVKNDPQGHGSAITYARRYSYMSMLGLAPEDDDGNEALKQPMKPEPKSVIKKEDDPIYKFPNGKTLSWKAIRKACEDKAGQSATPASFEIYQENPARFESKTGFKISESGVYEKIVVEPDVAGL